MDYALLVALIGIVVLVILLLISVPVAIALGVVGIGGYAVAVGWKPAMSLLATNPFAHASNISLAVVPLFILMGDFALYAGLGRKIFSVSFKWFGRMPGGLAIATIGACAGFAAMCGSALATTATIGKVAVPEMLRHGYDGKLATGSVAAAGTLGIMIPPSGLMIIYGYLTDTPIGKLLIAGIIPGILHALVYSIGIFTLVKLRPKIAPKSHFQFSLKEKIVSLKDGWGIAVIVFIIMGGIYSGVTTPTEAGAVAALVTFILFLLSPNRSFQNFRASLLATGKTTCMLMLIIVAAHLFAALLAYGNIPKVLAQYITSLDIPQLAILGLIALFYIVMGCFLEGLAMVLITIPVIFPAVMAMGYDPVWFGVFIVLMVETGQISPPFGMTCFVIRSIAPDVALEDIYKGAGFFLALDMIIIAILTAFPQIVLFLPNRI